MQTTWPSDNSLKNIIIKVLKRQEIKTSLIMEHQESRGKPWPMCKSSRRMEASFCRRAAKECTCRTSWHRVTSSSKCNLEGRVLVPWSSLSDNISYHTIGMIRKIHFRINHYPIGTSVSPVKMVSRARCQAKEVLNQKPCDKQVATSMLPKQKRWRNRIVRSTLAFLINNRLAEADKTLLYKTLTFQATRSTTTQTEGQW